MCVVEYYLYILLLFASERFVSPLNPIVSYVRGWMQFFFLNDCCRVLLFYLRVYQWICALIRWLSTFWISIQELVIKNKYLCKHVWKKNKEKYWISSIRYNAIILIRKLHRSAIINNDVYYTSDRKSANGKELDVCYTRLNNPHGHIERERERMMMLTRLVRQGSVLYYTHAVVVA